MLKLKKVPKNIKKLVKNKIFQEENGVSFILNKQKTGQEKRAVILKEKSVKALKNVLQKLL